MEDHVSPRSWPAVCRWMILVGLTTVAVPGVVRAWNLIHTRFEVSAQGLAIKGDLYGRVIPWSTLQVASARLVDLDQEPQYRPWLKMNGAGLPGYHSGWFRLKSREKALVFLTRSNLAVYVPTNQGYAVLVSPERPSEFLAAVQRSGAVVQEFRIVEGG
jgi:hypothetical protein